MYNNNRTYIIRLTILEKYYDSMKKSDVMIKLISAKNAGDRTNV